MLLTIFTCSHLLPFPTPPSHLQGTITKRPGCTTVAPAKDHKVFPAPAFCSFLAPPAPSPSLVVGSSWSPGTHQEGDTKASFSPLQPPSLPLFRVMRASLEGNQYLGTGSVLSGYKPELFLNCDYFPTPLYFKGEPLGSLIRTWTTCLTFHMATLTLLPKTYLLLQHLS